MPNDVPFRDYIDTRLAELDKRLNERFEAQEKALSLRAFQSHWIFTTALSVLALLVALAALFLKR